uniref:Peroxynitrite isomerase THAP4 n=1 Tax=Equus caballus TaxID=9796 RepID=A0A3Q2IAI0_HORSE
KRPRPANTGLSDPHGLTPAAAPARSARGPRSPRGRPAPRSRQASPRARDQTSPGGRGARREPPPGWPPARPGPHLRPSSLSGRRLREASLRRFRSATRRDGPPPGPIPAERARAGPEVRDGSPPAAILAYGGAQRGGPGSRARLPGGRRGSLRGPQQRPIGAAEAGVSGQWGPGAGASARRAPRPSARPSCQPPKMNPVVEPLSWMLGTWLSDPPGAGTFPTLQPFQYLEEVHISHVGQPMLNFSFNAFHPDTRKPMHRECGFIRLQPDTNKVAFVSAQNTGIVEVEEGEVNGQELCIASHSIARISFAKEPHVEQITRKFRLNSEGKLEQTVSMATTTQPMTQHLHITYKKVTP